MSTWTVLFNSNTLAEGFETREDAMNAALDHAVENNEDLTPYERIEVPSEFINYVSLEHRVEVVEGAYGCFGDLGAHTIWTCQRGCKAILCANPTAAKLYKEWQSK